MNIAISLGDPAGVGPEVVEKALQHVFQQKIGPVQFILLGPENIAQRLAERFAAQGVRFKATSSYFNGPYGQPSAVSGHAAWRAVDEAIRMAQNDEVSAIVTAPISKEALALAGCKALGHTELLKKGLAEGPIGMAFYTSSLKIVLATTHIPLAEVASHLSVEGIVSVGLLLEQFLLRMHEGATQERPIAVAGLNPHAGEGGLIGNEDISLIAPAVSQLQKKGFFVGPVSPDTVFRQAITGRYAGVVSMYHDQGLIPIKLLDFGRSAQVTLGLRVIRTSPDHGTAYDIAHMDKADPSGMITSLLLACRMILPGPNEG